MRLVAGLACLLLWPAAALAGGGSEHLGVSGRNGALACAVLQAADAQAGERVAVVDPGPPQSMRWATLQRPATDACAAWQRKADLPGRVFVLAFASAASDDEGSTGMVVRGATSVAVRHEKVVARLAGGSTLHFRGCTSSEGLHLSAWPSAKAAGLPSWHAYVYLGYDVEPTCSDAETRDAPSATDPAVRAGTAR